MEKIAFISDIHSNVPALEATLDEINSRGIDSIYCLGDIIGYHSRPNEVIEILELNGVESIKGNHDLAITEENFNRDNPGHFVLWWNYDALTEENKEYLKELPESLEISVEDVTIKLVHGSPDSIEEYIRKDSDDLSRFIKQMDTDVLLCGHTHIPYIHKEHGKFLLNTGSVGKPKVGRPECSFIELTIDGSNIEAEIIFVPYNVEEITSDLRDKGFPEKLITALETGNP